MPTKPSSYIPLIFKPMTSLLSTTAAASKNAKSVAQTQLFSQWMTQITHSVFQKMLEIFLEEIATVRKTEDSLNRLKKTRKTAATSASEITDTDKIQRQFQLDGFALQEQV